MGIGRYLRPAGASVALALTALAGCTTPTDPPTTTQPPPTTTPSAPTGFWELTGDVGVHDPSIIKEGNDWYTFSTGQGIQVLRSTNGGTNWSRSPQIFLREPTWWSTTVPGQANLDVWAPDARAFNGRTWLYYAISSFGSRNSAIGLASATSIGAGSWRDDGVVLRTSDADNYNAIDPELVIDAAGQPWLAFGSFWDGLKLTRLDPTTMKPTGGLTSIARRPAGIEAASIIRHGGQYILFASIDKCCQGVNSTYKIVYGRSTSITGPYLDRNGTNLLNGGGTVLDAGNDRWKGPGGEDVTDSGVLARHAYDATANGAPKLLINGLGWDPAGWPTY
jgi:arabinan endo-1,5-alpha-L-arabinosidase